MKRFLLGTAAIALVLAGCGGGGGGGSAGVTPAPTSETFDNILPQFTGTNTVGVSTAPNFSATQVTAKVFDNSSATNHVSFSLSNNGAQWIGSGPLVQNAGDTYTVQVSGLDSTGATVVGQTSFSVPPASNSGGGTTTGGLAPPNPPAFP